MGSLCALAFITTWLASPNGRDREWLIGLFALNNFLNIVWTMLFFRPRRPDWALVKSLVLWLSVLALMLVIWRQSGSDWSG